MLYSVSLVALHSVLVIVDPQDQATKRNHNCNHGEGGLFNFFFGVGLQSRCEISIDLAVVIYHILGGESHLSQSHFTNVFSFFPLTVVIANLRGDIITATCYPMSGDMWHLEMVPCHPRKH